MPRTVAAFLLCTLLLVGAAQKGAAEQDVAEQPTDWPMAIMQLRQRLDAMPGHIDTRKQLAIAYNNYAVELMGKERFAEAVQQLDQAQRFDPSNEGLRRNLVAVHLRMAQTQYRTNQIRQAKLAIDQALAIDPDAPDAYALLGEIEYHSQRLKEARRAWERALELAPERDDIRTRLDQLNEELPIESSFERLSQAFFDIRYTDEFERSSSFDLRDTLLEARRSIGSDFAFWSKRKLVVLVYNAEQFRQLRHATPEWVAGQYDGKIRVPLPGTGLDEATVTRILFHEYTHAVIHELTGNQCPQWLNEGVAEYEGWKSTGPQWTQLPAALAEGRLAPWAELSQRFAMARSAQEAQLAYEQSHSIVAYLVERYGFWRMRRLLKALAEDMPIDDALASEYRVSSSRLETNWQRWLKERLAQASSRVGHR